MPKETLSLAKLVEQILEAQKEYCHVLVITNTKRLAVAIWKELKGLSEDAFTLRHLSTLLYPKHRKRLIEELKGRGDAPTVVISTQVVEAGVDLDFPVVFREFGPLDRIVQAAGRCNRNGVPGRAPLGHVVVFLVEVAGSPPGDYQRAIDAARVMLRAGSDLHDPQLYEEFFQLYYNMLSDVGDEIQKRRRQFDFPGVAEMYKMINEDTVPLLVKQEALEDEKDKAAFSRVQAKGFATTEEWQRLQQFSVSVRASELAKLNPSALQMDWIPGLHVWGGYYHRDLGMGETVVMAVEDSIV